MRLSDVSMFGRYDDLESGGAKFADKMGIAFHKDVWPDTKVVINWGMLARRADRYREGQVILNKNTCSNKMKAHYRFAEVVNVPKVWHKMEYIPESCFPVLGRALNHSGGTDIVKIDEPTEGVSKAFFSQYIVKKAEYRVHVLGDRAIIISFKRRGTTGNMEDVVWNDGTGWGFREYSGIYFRKLAIMGVAAVKSLNYDFGAVDIIRGQDNQLYTLEVNSAPALAMHRARIYASEFKRHLGITL